MQSLNFTFALRTLPSLKQLPELIQRKQQCSEKVPGRSTRMLGLTVVRGSGKSASNDFSAYTKRHSRDGRGTDQGSSPRSGLPLRQGPSTSCGTINCVQIQSRTPNTAAEARQLTEETMLGTTAEASGEGERNAWGGHLAHTRRVTPSLTHQPKAPQQDCWQKRNT